MSEKLCFILLEAPWKFVSIYVAFFLIKKKVCFILNSLKVRTRFHSYFRLFNPQMSDLTGRTFIPVSGTNFLGLIWPGCATDLPGDRDPAPPLPSVFSPLC